MFDRLSAEAIEAIEPSQPFRRQARQDRLQRSGVRRFGPVCEGRPVWQFGRVP